MLLHPIFANFIEAEYRKACNESALKYAELYINMQSGKNVIHTLPCRQCDGCLKQNDCGRCINCKDKPKFGGNGVRKQKCLKRCCKRPYSAKAVESILARKVFVPSFKIKK